MKSLRIALCLIPTFILGCGGSSKPPADFTLAAAPASVSLVNGGPAQPITVVANAVNSFTGPVTVSLSGLPAGVTAAPATLSLTPGQLGQIMLTASGATSASSVSLTLTGTSGSLSHTATASLAVTSGVSSASLSATSFDFGGNLVGSTITQSVVTVTNSGSSSITLAPTLAGDASYSLISASSCGATLAASATCNETVSYTPTVASGSTAQTATLNLGLGNVPAGTQQTIALTGVSATLAAGTVTTSNNPQVALYTMTLPYPGAVTVSFGTDTTYGRNTWSQSTDVAGGTVSILVAGMLQFTSYHMQASVQFTNGLTAKDSDHVFYAHGAVVHPSLTATTTAGMTPQPGVELVTVLDGNANGGVVTDLQGNVIWAYATPAGQQMDVVKELPNGHFLVAIADGSEEPILPRTLPANNVVEIREVDLAGDIIKEISIADLNTEMAAAGYTFTLQQFHHDIAILPNGHWVVLSNIVVPETDLPGFPGTTNVLGDVIVDLDENLKPVWVWNEFDHLDVNRHPMNFPDWTHTNSVIYSPSDGNLIVSIRHQNWVVKVAYNDGAGNGDILWHLGEGGDFTLVNGTDPVDWNYAQHYASLFSANSSGVFDLGLMDNGDDRAGCTPPLVCPYTTIPVFKIDETAKTATLTFHDLLPQSLYSFFGGNTDLLANGNVEFCLSGVTSGSQIIEVTQTATPTTVWQMSVTGTYAYRGLRMPSLYPGVQW